MEIPPSNEFIKHIITVPQRNDILNPGILYKLIRIYLEEFVNIVQVKMHNNQFYQDVIRYILDRTYIIRPKSIRLFESFNQISLNLVLLHRDQFFSWAKLRKKDESTKFFGRKVTNHEYQLHKKGVCAGKIFLQKKMCLLF